MHRRHRVVNLVSLLAIVVGMFSPVLSLPVVAQKPPESATPVVETPVVLTPVVPEMSEIADAICGDGVVFAQVATAAETEGVSYTIGEPDAEGVFTVTATLTDTGLYRWADSGLDGWAVNGDVATASGTLALCPLVEEPAEGETPEQKPESDPSASESSTPTASRMDTNIGINAETDFVMTMSTALSGPIQAGGTITYTLSVQYLSEGLGQYGILGSLPEGVTFSGVEFPHDNDGQDCEVTEMSIQCWQADTDFIPNWPPDEWEISVRIDDDFVSASTCEHGLQAEFFGLWPGFTGTSPEPSTLSLPDSLCEKLSLESTTSTGGSVAEGEAFNYTVKVSNTGYVASGSYAFSSQLPMGLELAGDNPIISPTGSTCTPTPTGGVTTINCVGSDLPANTEPHLYVVSVRASTDLNPNICDTTHTIPVSGTAGALLGQNQQTPTFTITCAPLLTYTLEADKSTANYGDEITFTITVTNIGTADAGQYQFLTELSVGGTQFEHKDPLGLIQQPAGISCYSPSSEYTAFDCVNGASTPVSLAPNETHEFIIAVDVSMDACGTVVTRGGGDTNPHPDLWAEGSRYRSGTPPSLTTTVNCDWILIIGASSDPVADTVLHPGEEVEFWVNVQNTGTSPATDYSFHINSQEGALKDFGPYEYGGDSDELRGRECWKATDGSFDCGLMTGGTIIAGFSEFYKFRGTVKAATPELCQNGVQITLTPTGDTWSNSDPITTHFPVDCSLLELLELSVTDHMTDEEPIGLNEEFTYTVTVTNRGPGVSGDFSFRSVLPAGIIPSEDPAEGCTSEIVSGLFNITCSGSGVHPGGDASASFDIPVIAVDTDGTGVCAEVFVENQVFAGDGVWAEDQDEAYERTYIECVSSFTFTNEPLGSPVVPGESIGYQLTVHNSGTMRITSLVIEDDDIPDLPDGSDWNIEATLNDTPVSMGDFERLDPGDTLVVTITSSDIPTDITLPESEWCRDWTSTATAHVGFSWGNDQEATRSANVRVNCTGLSIDQQVSSALIPVGGQVEYTITVTNHGNTTVSPMQVFHDSSETGTVFSNWNVTSENAMECGLAQNDDPGCTYLTLAPQESAVITITGDAPAVPTDEQCAPVTSRAMVVYGDVLTMAQASVGITPPYTPLYSEPVTTQLDCQYGVDISSTAVVNTGDDGRVDAGDTVTFTIEVENTGTVTLYDLTISHDLAGVVWDDDLFIDELGPADTVTITGTYTVTQEDIDAGEIVTTMSVEGGVVAAIEAARVVTFGFAQPADDGSGEVSESITETIELTQEPGVRLEVSSDADTGDDDEMNLGDTITYTFVVKNTGNVTLTDLDIVSGIDGLTFPDGTSIATLAPGDEATVIATYTINQADVDSGVVEMCADAVATDPNNAPVNASDVCVTIEVAQPVPVTPTPTPDPVTPDPTTPPTPDVPATPDSSATLVPTEDDTESVTGLPETGHGPGVMTPILWVAATLSIIALGIGGIGVRRSRP